MSAYYMALRIWALAGTTPIWLRALSLLFALAGLACAVHLVRTWLGDQLARWVGVFIALSYLWGDQAGEARSYAMALLLSVASWGALDRIVSAGQERPLDRRRAALAYFCLWTLLPPTHGLSVLVLGAQIVSMGLGRVGRSCWRSAVPGVVAALGLTAVLYVLGASGVTNWVQPTNSYAVIRTLLIMSGPTPVLGVALWSIMLLGLALVFRTWKTAATPLDRFRATAPATWALIPVFGLILLSFRIPLLVPRYLVCALPGTAILLSIGLKQVIDMVDQDRRSLALPLAVGATAFCLAFSQMAIRAEPDDRWDQATQVVHDNGKLGDGIAFPERRNRVPFEASWHASEIEDPVPVDFPRPLGDVRYVEREFSRVRTLHELQHHDRIWLVYEWVFDPDSPASLRSFEKSDEFASNFDLVRKWSLDRGIRVALYERR